MQNLQKFFSSSIADEIMPILPHSQKNLQVKSFALILESGESISISDVLEIKNRTSLSPLFLDISHSKSPMILRSYARSLGSPIIKPQTITDLSSKLSECSFCICEEIYGALLSFLSYTPVYVNSGNEDCRSLVGEISKWQLSSEIIIPYTKNRVTKIHVPFAKSADFSFAIKKFRTQISAKFLTIF